MSGVEAGGEGSSGWQAVVTDEPVATPAEVDWSSGTEVGCPGSLLPPEGDATEQAEYWWRTRTSAESLTIEQISFPAEVFVDGRSIARSVSEFLPLQVELPGTDCEVAIVCRSLAGWLGTRRPRGRWRSALTGTQGLRWARVSLVGRVAAYPAPAPAVGARGVRFGTPAALGDVRVGTRLRGSVGVLTVQATTLRPGEHTITVSGPDGTWQQTVTADDRMIGCIEIDRPHLWWPAGYGEPACYTLTITRGEEELVRRSIGFRSIEVDRSAGGFSLSVNGIPVFCRGAVLTGPAPGGAAVIDTLADAGATMVRFAGGTVPASAELMQRCAERGVLVWHDCMLATFDLPTDLDPVVVEELWQLLGAYAGNPALAVICGGSETEQQPELMGLPRDRRQQPLLTDRLPAALDEWCAPVGAQFCHVAASPTGGSSGSALRPDDGVAHWFGVGGYRQPLTAVDAAGVRFATECLAFANPPEEISTGLAAVRDREEPWLAGIPADRGADWDFEQVRDHYLAEVFGTDPQVERRRDPARYLDLGRAATVVAMERCFRRWRRGDDPCAGALVLSAFDLRDGSGWGVLDHRGRPKAVLSALRRCWAPVTILAGDAGLAGIRVDAYNDTPAELAAVIELRASDAFGNVTVSGTLPVRLPAHGAVRVHDDEISGHFSDLGYAYRFGSPVADAVEVRLLDDVGRCLARDALVIAPAAAPQPVDTVQAVLDPEAKTLTVTSARALRAVAVRLPGHEVADDWFELPGGLAYRVPVRRVGSTDTEGWVRSVDLAGPVPITLGPGGVDE
ncbi:hypothetical protein [Enemella evansiae]|uniref:hypothetical protein n=1 Tax=Enemella evansiae TaxID=2016499 RepID=UPI00117F71E4|nr:hypothetical protein [Enemella evansiae]